MTFIYTWQDVLLGSLIAFFISIFVGFCIYEYAKKKVRALKNWWSNKS